MAKQKMKAQLRYHKNEEGCEGYAINIYSNGEWGLDKWFPLVARADGDGQPDYVHWALLNELSHLQQLGYEIDLVF